MQKAHALTTDLLEYNIEIKYSFPSPIIVSLSHQYLHPLRGQLNLEEWSSQLEASKTRDCSTSFVGRSASSFPPWSRRPITPLELQPQPEPWL